MMDARDSHEKQYPHDFAALKLRFDKELTNGQRAEIRRAGTPGDLELMPAYYRLLRGVRSSDGWLRVVFLLPHAAHSEGAESVGASLGRTRDGRPAVSEMRLFQVVRSGEPNDIIGFRRILQQAEPAVNWRRFGNTVFWWNKEAKRRIVEDYFMAGYKGENDNKEAEDER
jgi:CRISPR system Cascade subunit CasB